MAKEYFSHDYDAVDDLKMVPLIHQFKARGYGIYWMAAEMLHQNGGYLPATDNTYMAIAKKLSEKISLVKTVVEKCFSDFDLFIQDDGKFYSNRALRNLDKRKEIKEKRSKAGQASAASRQQNSTNGQHMLTHVEQNPTKERKGKEIKGKENSKNRANALVVSETTHEARKKYDELIEENRGKEVKIIYTAIQEFVKQHNPSFAEPYVDAWNIVASKYNLESVTTVSDDRREKIRIRSRENAFDFFKILASIRQNKFYQGEGGNGHWKVTFNYIIKNETNYIQIIEKYQPSTNGNH